jgi:hypothetical protein
MTSIGPYQSLVNALTEGYARKQMNYVLDVIYVNGRENTNVNVQQILTDHEHDGCKCHGWELINSVGNIDRYFLKLSEIFESERHILDHIRSMFRGKPVDFTLLKCVYEPEHERMTKPNEIWRRDVADGQ